MDINRNNYQQFFLLFADNELSANGRDKVMRFVEQNADLEEEFLMIQQSIVKPDRSIGLGDKSFLLKHDSSFINASNYEEKFLEYYDGELNEEERSATEKFINDHPEKLQEFEMLGKVKLDADPAVTFPDKRLLLRKEKDGKITPLYVWRSVAAAVILGIGLWAGFDYFKPSHTIVTGSTVSAGKTPEQHRDTTTGAVNQGNSLAMIIVKPPESKKRVVKEKIIQSSKPIAGITVKNNNNNNTSHSHEPVTIDKPDLIHEPVSNNDNHDIAMKTQETKEELKQIVTKPEETEKTVTKNYAVRTSYVPENKNDDYVFYNVTEEEFKKSKLGTFLKKVKRVIERKSPFNHNDKAEVAIK